MKAKDTAVMIEGMLNATDEQKIAEFDKIVNERICTVIKQRQYGTSISAIVIAGIQYEIDNWILSSKSYSAFLKEKFIIVYKIDEIAKVSGLTIVNQAKNNDNKTVMSRRKIVREYSDREIKQAMKAPK